MRTLLVLIAALSVGCDSLREEVPGLFAATPHDVAESAPTRNQPNRLPQLARQLESKFKAPAMPALDASHACNVDAAISSAESEGAQVAVVSVDVRAQTKNLIPRRVSERLESGELGLLGSVLDNSTESAQRNAPASATSLTLEDLQRIQRRRYLGVFYVTDYQGPALILRVGKIRREWYPGNLGARFALVDSEEQRVICACDLRVTNDVKTAPIRMRLQAETRSRLERELGDSLRRAAEQATANLATQLTWPGTDAK